MINNLIKIKNLEVQLLVKWIDLHKWKDVCPAKMEKKGMRCLEFKTSVFKLVCLCLYV